MDMDYTNRSVSRKVLTYEKGGFSSRSRELAQETCWTIMVGGNALETFSCSPWDLEQAALGILFFRERIVQAEEVSQLTVYPEKGLMEAELTSLPPLSRKAAPHLTLRASQILELAAGLEEGAGLFRRTGGVHTAALARGREIFLRREDVSQPRGPGEAGRGLPERRPPHGRNDSGIQRPGFGRNCPHGPQNGLRRHHRPLRPHRPGLPDGGGAGNHPRGLCPGGEL